MKLACIFITHFPFKAEAQRRPELRQQPSLVVRAEGSHKLVADFSPSLHGVEVGMPLQQALTYARSAKLVEADDAYYRSLSIEILDALERRSPAVEEAGIGCAYVGLGGLEELYDGEARLVVMLQRAVPAHYGARVGIGSNKFIAYVAAASAEPGRAVKAPEDGRRFLSSLSVDLLPVSYRTRSRLHEFALHRLGDVTALSAGALQAQLGPEGRLAWELASGIDRRPLTPRKQPLQVTEHLSFPSPVSSMEPILFGLDRLLDRAFSRPEIMNRYARAAEMQGQVFRAGAWHKRAAFKDPVGSKPRALFILKNCIEASPLPGPLEDLGLTLSGLTGESGRQGSLFTDVRRREQIAEAVKEMESRFGARPPLFRVVEVEPWSRIPERRRALVPFVP